MSQFFASGGQSSGASASASVLPVNIQGCFPNSPWWFIWEVTSLGTGEREEREGGRRVRQRCSHRARMLLWAAGPSCRGDPQGSHVAHSLYWVRVTSASTKSPSPIVDRTPGLNGLPWGTKPGQPREAERVLRNCPQQLLMSSGVPEGLRVGVTGALLHLPTPLLEHFGICASFQSTQF